MRVLKVVTAAVTGAVVLAFAGCQGHIPYRTAGLYPNERCPRVFSENDEKTNRSGGIAEHFAKDECWLSGHEKHLAYDLLTVEFDDQGWIQGSSGEKGSESTKPNYLDGFLKKLETLYNENRERGLTIVVYVHGWHHNADPFDSNVTNFRKFLGELAVANRIERLREGSKPWEWEKEGTYKPRVVGVYVGWRGESVSVPGLKELTFWERKNTAETVANGSIVELLQQLDYARDCGRTELTWAEFRKPYNPHEKDKEKGYRNVQMLIIGHSFGGLVTYRALSSSLVNTAVRASATNEQEKAGYVARFGDLVVIVNPAFEGARYEPLHAAGQRIQVLQKSQLPTVIVATSQKDYATKYMFPIARAVSTIFESQPGAEYDAAVKAIGHNDRYTTHRLSKCVPSDAACKAQCRTQFDLNTPYTEGEKDVLGEREFMKDLGEKGFVDEITYLCKELRLERTSTSHLEHNPYWVVSTTGDIMDGHNDIFNPRFVSFFRQMYLGITVARGQRPAPRCETLN